MSIGSRAVIELDKNIYVVFPILKTRLFAVKPIQLLQSLKDEVCNSSTVFPIATVCHVHKPLTESDLR